MVGKRTEFRGSQDDKSESSSELAGSRTSMIRIVIPVMKPSDAGIGVVKDDE